QANQLARRLRTLGVGPEVRVGICLERSLDTIISILGTLKAGGVYVPLDPNYPPARLELMVRDADAKVVLTRAALRKRLPDKLGTVMLLDQDQEAGWQELQDPPATEPDSLAYVMYTSGSTGTPKGVAVTHRNVVRLVRNTSYVSVREDDVFLQFAPISFDAATFEIWGALLNGAQLALAPAENLSVEGMGVAINRFGVTTLWLTAGLFHLMAEECLDTLRGVRHLLAGGDVLRTGIVKELLRELPSCRLTNGYGPTEGTTFSCCC